LANLALNLIRSKGYKSKKKMIMKQLNKIRTFF
jgi:hypothetical protein